MIERLGSEYGGHWVDVDGVPIGSTALDCGVGMDTSFSEELATRRGVRVVFIDPSAESLRRAVLRVPTSEALLAAVSNRTHPIPMHLSSGSESSYPDHRDCSRRFRIVDGISLAELIARYGPSVVKLDIEGAEYDALQQCGGVDQISVEFHHGIVRRFTERDTDAAVERMLRNGYSAARFGVRDVLFTRQPPA